MKSRRIRLGDVIEINPSEKLDRAKEAKKVSMGFISPYSRKIEGYELKFPKSGAKFRNRDTLLARITPCLENGKTAFVDILDDDEVAFGSTEFYVLRARKCVIDPLYLYYLSVSDEFRDEMIKSMTGTSGRQRVPKEAIQEYEFDLPELKIQKQISRRIDLIDRKIELNKSINDNLAA